MSFRRNADKERNWKIWIEQRRDELVACGVPLLVLEDKTRWLYFLDHGCFTPVGGGAPIIDVDYMGAVEMERLCLFLENDVFYPESDALNRLQFLLKRGRYGDDSV